MNQSQRNQPEEPIGNIVIYQQTSHPCNEPRETRPAFTELLTLLASDEGIISLVVFSEDRLGSESTVTEENTPC